MNGSASVWKSLLEWLPPEVRAFLVAGGWWWIAAVLIPVGGLLLGGLLSRTWRALLARFTKPSDLSDRELYVDLESCPLPTRPPGEYHLTVYHLPVRLRLVVVAPLGKEAVIDVLQVEDLLDQVLPGLGKLTRDERPRVRVWPPELSYRGFTMAFRRRVALAKTEESVSRWILAAGRAAAGQQTILLGLGLWAEEPCTLGYVNLESHQWRDVLRLRRTQE